VSAADSATAAPDERVLDALREARAFERNQTVFYRALAVDAEDSGDFETAERLNGLLADEQHHFSRISARFLEWGLPIPDVPASDGRPGLDGWEAIARERENTEIERYQLLLDLPLDPRTRSMIEEFLEAERGHAESLGGKWMGA
jgi:rubrerythrin